jgi:hypothetical protein
MSTVAIKQPQQDSTSAAALVAVAVSARRTGDRELERDALQELRDQHGLRLSFAAPSPQAKESMR